MSTQDLATLLPYCSVTYGWHLAGPGAARYGWAARTASGMIEYLGKNRTSATLRARELGTLFGS